jgi:hypothetical protein
MKMYIILVVGFFVSNSLIAQNIDTSHAIVQEWIYVTSSKKDDNPFYIKSEYIKKEGSIIKLWTKSIKKTDKVGNKVYNNVTLMYLSEYDCQEQTSRTLKVIVYDAKGSLIDSESYEFESFEDVIPGSIGSALIKKICQYYFK